MTDFYQYQAKVLRIIDGDTVDLEVDLGFDVFQRMRIRLFGINAPEMSTPEGKVARFRFGQELPLGATVHLNSIKDKRDKYGRYLGILVYNGVNMNDWLVEEGLADPASY